MRFPISFKSSGNKFSHSTHVMIISFLSEFCKTQALNKDKILGMGRGVGNLYVLNTPGSPTVCNVSSTQHYLWHSRMDHPSLSILLALGNTPHFDSPKHDDLLSYSICHLEKQKRFPFVSNNTSCDAPFDLVI